MPEARSLRVRVVVDSRDPLSAAEFVDLFKCADDFIRHIAEQQALNFLEAIGLPPQTRIGTMRRLHRLGRRAPLPAEVERVERGSWIAVVLLTGPARLYFLKSYVDPMVQDAWNESQLRERIVHFLRDHVFGGAHQQAEQKAIRSPRYGNLEVTEVTGRGGHAGDEIVEIHLRRRHVLEVHSSEQQLIDEFIEGVQ